MNSNITDQKCWVLVFPTGDSDVIVDQNQVPPLVRDEELLKLVVTRRVTSAIPTLPVYFSQLEKTTFVECMLNSRAFGIREYQIKAYGKSLAELDEAVEALWAKTTEKPAAVTQAFIQKSNSWQVLGLRQTSNPKVSDGQFYLSTIDVISRSWRILGPTYIVRQGGVARAISTSPNKIVWEVEVFPDTTLNMLGVCGELVQELITISLPEVETV